MIRTTAIIYNGSTGERFEVAIPTNVHPGRLKDLAIVAVIEIEDGLAPHGEASEFSEAYLASFRTQYQAFQAWLAAHGRD